MRIKNWNTSVPLSVKWHEKWDTRVSLFWTFFSLKENNNMMYVCLICVAKSLFSLDEGQTQL